MGWPLPFVVSCHTSPMLPLPGHIFKPTEVPNQIFRKPIGAAKRRYAPRARCTTAAPEGSDFLYDDCTITSEASMANFNSTAGKLLAVTKSDANLPGGRCIGLLVGTAGTANLQDATGATLANVPLQLGYNMLSVLQVRTGGTAADIWALYEVP